MFLLNKRIRRFYNEDTNTTRAGRAGDCIASSLRDNAGDDHKFEFEGLDLVIYKDVFSPSYFNGWRTFTPALRKRIVEGMDFLEIGVGSGITSLLLAQDGVCVSASDISPLAVENTKINAEKNTT